MPKDNMTNELKSCPFCGGKPTININKTKYCQFHGDPSQDFTIFCCVVSITKSSKEDCRIAWNSRSETNLTYQINTRPAPDPKGEWTEEAIYDWMIKEGYDIYKYGHKAFTKAIFQRFNPKPSAELRIELNAWYKAFGTTQLSHALVRLEMAERKTTKPAVGSVEEIRRIVNGWAVVREHEIGGAIAQAIHQHLSGGTDNAV